MECSLSSFTRNMALGSNSITVPLNSIISSFDISPLRIVTNGPEHGGGPREGQEPVRFRTALQPAGRPPVTADKRCVTCGQTAFRSPLSTDAEKSAAHGYRSQ